MTISSTDRKAGPFAGDGSTTVFPYAFKVFATSDLYVVKADSTGAETVLSLTTHYTATMNGNQDTTPGGNVTLLTALAVGETLIVTTQLGYLQGVALTNQGGFYPTVINSALDRLVIYIQQLSEQISRTLKVAITSPDGTDVDLPSPVAYSLIGWNGTADGLQNVDPTYSTALYTDLANTSDIAKGDAMIGFKQSGTGAVARTAHDKLGEIVSVKDFGAVGDGVADESTAFQAAINAASGRPIFIPNGTYKFTAGLTYDTSGQGVCQGLKLIGEDMHDTILDNLTGGALITVTSGPLITDFQENVILKQLTISNSTSVAGSKAIFMRGIRGASLTYLYIKDQTDLGVHIYSTQNDADSCVHIDIDQCNIEGCANSGIRCEGVTLGVVALVSVRQTRLIANGIGVDWYSMQNGTIENCAIAYNTSYGVYITNGTAYSKNCTVLNNEFDSNGGTQLYIDQGTNIVVDGNAWVVNSGYPVTANISATSASVGVTMRDNWPRVPAGVTGVSMFVVGALATSVRIINTHWDSWSATGNTKYNGTSAPNIEILDGGQYLTPVRASGGGVAFPATQSPSSDANTLDDYEEGTWTPVDASGAGLSLTGASGYFTKIGRLVTVSGQWVFPSTANGSNINIGGLPFICGGNSAGGLLQNSGNSGDSYLIPIGTSSVYIYSGGSLTRRTNANYSSASVYFSGSYIV